MKSDFVLVIPASLDGRRADAAVLELCPFSSRRAVAHAFAQGWIAGPKGRTVRAGEEIRVGRLHAAEDLRVIPEPDAPLRVVHEDARIVGLDKPAGQACHPLDFDERGTLAAALVARYPETAAVGDDPLIPGLLHRIDGGTSGLVLAARDPEAHAAVRAQFEARTVGKEYRALVEGRIDRPGAVSGYLAHSYRGGTMRMVPASPGHHGARALRAETFFRPIGGQGGRTLLAVSIRTGVTHQIRCQLASIGHPVAGDVLYGAPPCDFLPPGTHALHSFSATFVHPGTGRRITVSTPIPGNWPTT